MIAGNGGSGGLIGYIKGILSADVVPDDTQVQFCCGRDLAGQIENVAKGIRIVPLDELSEKGRDIVFGKKLPRSVIDAVNNFSPNFVYFLNGYLRNGLENYPNIMVLHNQLYIDKRQLWREGFSLSLLKKLLFKVRVTKDLEEADGVVFLSNFSMKQTLDKGYSVRNPVVIPIGFEDHNRAVEVVHRSIGSPVKFLYISALYPYKNQIELIKGLSRFKNYGLEFELHLVGAAQRRYLRKLERVIDELEMNENVVFHNWIDHREIKRIIDEMDIFVYASSIETTGYGLLEGMSRGALIISSNRSGFPEMLGNGGIFFDPEDPCSFYKAAKSVLDSNHMLDSLRREAFERSLSYSWERAASELYDYLRSIVQSKTASPKNDSNEVEF